MRFYIDGNEQSGKISGTVNWTQKSYVIPSGSHTLKWAYSKDSSTSSGSDCGWLDKVRFYTGGTTNQTYLTILSGNCQQACMKMPLSSFVVKLTDNYDDPVDSCSVAWQIIEPCYGAVLSTTSTTTNINGTTSTILTLGTKTGTYQVTANVSGLMAIFTTIATPAYVTVYNASGGFVGNYTTIQAGVNACPAGGTVSVSAGTYTEAIYINKRIALVGVGMPTITATGLGATNTVTFDGTATTGAVLSGFRISGVAYMYYGGVYCKNNAKPTITNNTISGNGGDGIYCSSSSSSPTITNNTISGNRNYGINCSSSSPTITNNIIAGNGDDGIYCGYSSSPTITNNTISGNGGDGIYCFSFSSPIITNNIITTNGTSNYGSYYGIYVSSGTPIITYNNVWGNGSNGNQNYSGCSVGTNDISANPQFIGQNDYHLQICSPCIDAGSNIARGISGTSTDKDGNSRIVRTVDMGAYEYQETLTKIRIEDESGQEIGVKTLVIDNPLTLYLRGYDAKDVWLGNVAGIWTVINDFVDLL